MLILFIYLLNSSTIHKSENNTNIYKFIKNVTQLWNSSTFQNVTTQQRCPQVIKEFKKKKNPVISPEPPMENVDEKPLPVGNFLEISHLWECRLINFLFYFFLLLIFLLIPLISTHNCYSRTKTS